MKIKSITLGNLERKSNILLDSIRGLDFLKVIQPHEVGLDPIQVYRSSPSGDKYLKKMLIDFNISSQDSIIDIGCGKGSAMRTMLKFPFTNVDGIELSEYIAEIAKKNFKKLGKNRSSIYIGDAAHYKKYDSYNFIYFYNPFPSNVMFDVIERLKESIDRNDRELILIYNNATCNDVIVSQSFFMKMGLYNDKWGNLISIYSNRNYDNSRLCTNKYMKRFV